MRADLEALMREALAEAAAAGEAGELPIGAVVAVNGEVVARGRARHHAAHSQVAHAELDALRAGGEPLLTCHDEAVLVSTLEPCPMCLGAAVMADVPHVVFGAYDTLAGVRGMLDIPYVRRHIVTYRGGVLADESRALVERYAPKMLDYVTAAAAPPLHAPRPA
jgi:tRNA(adenine34) deaminase